jgi:DNA-binding MarR family transcriptional regulator
MNLAHRYVDAVMARLQQSTTTPAERAGAMATLLLILSHLDRGTYICDKTATDLAMMRGVPKSRLTKTLALLEKVGAIGRVRQGRAKVIVLTPEKALQEALNGHSEDTSLHSVPTE